MLAKNILKICKQEANEIDTCAECYHNANTRADWFVDVCSQPHLLLWAKLKGFPYWPAKSMSLGQGSHVNVRFFGEHDRAFVPIKDCYLLSEADPNVNKTGKRSVRSLADCLKEVKLHIAKIKEKVGNFKYAAFKTAYDPAEEMQQLENMMPGVGEYMKRNQGNCWSGGINAKPPLQYKIVKTGNNHLSIKLSSTTNESGNDSEDNSSSPGRKNHRQTTISCNEEPQIEAAKVEKNSKEPSSSPTPVVTSVTANKTKYEVITKPNNEEGSKITAVILKRKSAVLTEANAKKIQDEMEVSLPKMTKIDDLAAKVEEKKQVAATVSNEQTDNKETNNAQQETNSETNAENAMENLVKNKQGVTIKKIVKDSAAINNKNVSAKPAEETAAQVMPKEKVVNIFKDLVPFVEVKKEITSEDEAEAQQQSPKANKTASPAQAVPAKPTIAVMPLPELITVKQEVFSDEEEINNAAHTANTQTAVNANDMEASKSQSTPNAEVRVVGDTTIQRISTKPLPSTANASSSQATAGTSSQTGSSKRSGGLKGIPYGPLPASAAVPKTSSNSIKNISGHDNRKIAQSNHEACSVDAQKRNPLKNSMVSIPVDVANNNSNLNNHNNAHSSTCITNQNSNNNSNIPIPPLTAVSKTMPTSTMSTNSMAANSCNGPTTNKNALLINSSNSLSSSGINYSSTIPPPLAGLSNTVPAAAASSSLATATASNASNINSNELQQQQINNLHNSMENLNDGHLLGSTVTPTLASAITELICRGPPKLFTRPGGPLQSDGSVMFPSQAGPVCKTLVENAHKVSKFSIFLYRIVHFVLNMKNFFGRIILLYVI